MTGSFSSWRGGAALALVVFGAAFTACSLDSGGTGQPGPTGTGGAGGTGGVANTGGAGGDGGAGGEAGAGGAGGGGPEPLAAWDAGAPDLATGTYTLPDWLVLESPSDRKTSQIGPDMLRTGFGPDEPRARSVDGTTWGLSVESERTNRAQASHYQAGIWQGFNATVSMTTGPDGTDVATLVADETSAAQGALVVSFTPELNAESTVSAWMTTPASNTVNTSLECNTFPAQQSTRLVSPGTGWHRASITGAETVAAASLVRFRPVVGGSSEVGSASIDLVSVETGLYPSSVIITHPVDSPAPATRMAESLYAPAAGDLAPGGYFHAVLVFAPHYAAGEQSGAHDLLVFDDQHRVYVRQDSAVVLQEEGTDVLFTAPLDWERDQELTVEVLSLPGSRRLRVTGAAGGEAVVEDGGGAAFPTDGPLYLLGGPTGAQEGADLRAITFYPPPM